MYMHNSWLNLLQDRCSSCSTPYEQYFVTLKDGATCLQRIQNGDMSVLDLTDIDTDQNDSDLSLNVRHLRISEHCQWGFGLERDQGDVSVGLTSHQWWLQEMLSLLPSMRRGFCQRTKRTLLLLKPLQITSSWRCDEGPVAGWDLFPPPQNNPLQSTHCMWRLHDLPEQCWKLFQEKVINHWGLKTVEMWLAYPWTQGAGLYSAYWQSIKCTYQSGLAGNVSRYWSTLLSWQRLI